MPWISCLAGSGFSWKKTPYYYLVTSSKLLSPGFLQGSETRRVKLSHIEAEMAVKLLSDAFKPYVQAQTAGRTVFVTAPSTLVERIVTDLKQLDKRPRQVMLESKIVVLEKGDLLNLGVEWGWPTTTVGMFGSDTHNTATDTLADFAGKFPWGVQIGYSPDGTFTNALTMALNLLAENSEAKIMSNPQMFAQDGKKCRLLGH